MLRMCVIVQKWRFCLKYSVREALLSKAHIVQVGTLDNDQSWTLAEGQRAESIIHV